jgi:hypothetical protein
VSITSPVPSQPTPPPNKDHSRVGIASFILGLLALVTVLILFSVFFSQSYWESDGYNVVDILRLPCITFSLMVSGAILGIISIAENSNKKVFGVLGLLMSLLTILACCSLFALIFASSGGFGG